MEEQNNQTNYEKLSLPKQIILSNGVYTFIVQLINSYVCYRCIHRTCKASIKNSIENAKKLINKDNEISSVKIVFSGEHINHPKKEKIEENTDKIKIEKNNLELAK